MTGRNLARSVLGTLLYGALLFGGAGSWCWTAGWVFLGLQLVLGTALMVWLRRHDPALYAERFKGLFQPGQPIWDRVILGVFSGLWLAWFVLPGLDAVRHGWSHVPVGWEIAGGVLHLLGWWGMIDVHRVNTFLAPVVRIQEERGHRVVDTGLYAIVRHPMYAALLLWLPGAGLMLGSWWAAAASCLVLAPMVLRTYLEDECLARDLPGYEDYRRRVRYRLVPGLW